MHRPALFICLVVLSLPLFADALPVVKVETQWLQCQIDSDCDILRDACRSCGVPIALNKTHVKDYLERDYAQRKAAKMMITCEACSQQNVVISCENSQCRAVRK